MGLKATRSTLGHCCQSTLCTSNNWWAPCACVHQAWLSCHHFSIRCSLFARLCCLSCLYSLWQTCTFKQKPPLLLSNLSRSLGCLVSWQLNVLMQSLPRGDNGWGGWGLHLSSGRDWWCNISCKQKTISKAATVAYTVCMESCPSCMMLLIFATQCCQECIVKSQLRQAWLIVP